MTLRKSSCVNFFLFLGKTTTTKKKWDFTQFCSKYTIFFKNKIKKIESTTKKKFQNWGYLNLNFSTSNLSQKIIFLIENPINKTVANSFYHINQKRPLIQIFQKDFATITGNRGNRKDIDILLKFN